ncbi:MAG: MFS transporter [Peptococcaceae bacterium]|nr:MFS transporter [Peptococcaceae bacterium]MBP3624401.1 MFS transporter [Peptococcaceae bacterium]
MHYAWVILICCCLIEIGSMGAVANCLGLYVVPVCEEFGIGAAAFSLYFTIQNISVAIASSFAGKLMTKYGVKKTLLVAIIINAIWFAGLSMAQSITAFYVLGALIGLTFSLAMFLPVPALITAWFAEKRGFAMGLAMAFAGIGGAGFSVVYSNIIEVFGWRTSYMAMAVISLVIILPCVIFFLKDTPEQKGCLPYGKADTAAIETENGNILTGIDASGVLKRGIFWATILVGGLAAYVCNNITYLSAHGSTVGLSIVTSGSLISAALIGSMIGALVLGSLADKIGIKRTFYVACTIVIAGTALLVIGNGFIVLFVASVAFGFSSAIYTTMMPLLVQELFGSKDYGTIYSYTVAGMSFIAAMSCILIGLLYDITGAYVAGLLVALAAYVIFMAAITLMLRRKYY